MSQTPSARWCPTPEQLMILEEMYRSGVRNPNASQIQQITDHLSMYGKIEGKNVFYWFQNHKARDRQKLRRRSLHHQSEEVPSPTSVHHETPSHFLPEGYFQDAATQEMNLVGKLEAAESQEEGTSAASSMEGDQQCIDVNFAISSCCRPPKTLDLFPTETTGIKDKCSSSKSSSCSKTIN